MWDWLTYKIRAKNPAAAIDLIDRHAELIEIKNSGHVYSHTVVSVIRYRNILGADDRIIGYVDPYYWQRSDFWFKQLQTEKQLLDLVYLMRKNYLFGSMPGCCWHRDLSATNEHILAFDRRLKDIEKSYDTVIDRDTERRFLADGDRQLRPLFWQCPRRDPALSIESEWHYITRYWRWMKRNTSRSSFPFIRPGLDIIKTFNAIDLGGDEGKIWYATALFHY